MPCQVLYGPCTTGMTLHVTGRLSGLPWTSFDLPLGALMLPPMRRRPHPGPIHLRGHLKPQRIRSRYIGSAQTIGWTNGDGWQVLVPDYGKVRQVVVSLFAPPSGQEDAVAEEAARIQVRNGTYQPQLALIAADQLRWYGVNVVDAAPADRPDYQ